jgi:hypothetical protein
MRIVENRRSSIELSTATFNTDESVLTAVKSAQGQLASPHPEAATRLMTLDGINSQ